MPFFFLSEIPGEGESHCEILSGVKSSQEIHEVGRRMRTSHPWDSWNQTGSRTGHNLSESLFPWGRWDFPPLVSMYLRKHKHILLKRRECRLQTGLATLK